jgi:hypothetical protein
MKRYKSTKRELSDAIADLQRQIYDVEAKLNALADHSGVWINDGPTVTKRPDIRKLP